MLNKNFLEQHYSKNRYRDKIKTDFHDIQIYTISNDFLEIIMKNTSIKARQYTIHEIYEYIHMRNIKGEAFCVSFGSEA